MNHASRKLAALASALILAGLLTFFSVPVHSIQSQAAQPVDVAVTSITNVDGGLMYFNGRGRSMINVPINVTIERLDNNGLVAALFVNFTLNGKNVTWVPETSENVTIYSGVYVLAPAPAPGVTVQVLMNNGTTFAAGNYDIYAFADPLGDVEYGTDIVDTNMTNNIDDGGIVKVAIGIKEDVLGMGDVNMVDVISVVNAIGMTGPPGWIPQDLMSDGVIDWFDLLMVNRMFTWSIGNSAYFQPRPVAWNLTISTPPIQTQNDTVVILSNYIVYSEYSFNETLKQLSFNITSSIDGFCNVSIPATSMSGAFTVYLDDVPTPSIITWNYGNLKSWITYQGDEPYLDINATRYFVYFNTTGLSQKVRIVSEYANAILGDINHDGTVNILDAITLSNAFLATPGSPNWNPNADINNDGVVNILDSIIMSNHFLEHYP